MLHHKKSNYYFNIEIDESYVFDSKDPIHYVTKNERNEIVNYSEFKRDYEITEYYSWIIIRFAEIQIVKNPQNCIDLILSIIPVFLVDEGLEDYPAPILNKNFHINRWTFEESIEYSQNNYRQSYLNKILLD